MSECLRDTLDPMKLIKKTDLPNLDVLTAGERVPSPSHLFESDRLAEVLEKVQFYYDMVIVDSPPVVAVSDTLFLCREIESVLFVVLAGVTSRDLVARAKDILVDANANIAGVVVNNVSGILPQSYDYRYYGYSEKR
jgi:capsular exopolysaccharide synthesis family protein